MFQSTNQTNTGNSRRTPDLCGTVRLAVEATGPEVTGGCKFGRAKLNWPIDIHSVASASPSKWLERSFGWPAVMHRSSPERI